MGAKQLHRKHCDFREARTAAAQAWLSLEKRLGAWQLSSPANGHWESGHAAPRDRRENPVSFVDRLCVWAYAGAGVRSREGLCADICFGNFDGSDPL